MGSACTYIAGVCGSTGPHRQLAQFVAGLLCGGHWHPANLFKQTATGVLGALHMQRPLGYQCMHACMLDDTHVSYYFACNAYLCALFKVAVEIDTNTSPAQSDSATPAVQVGWLWLRVFSQQAALPLISHGASSSIIPAGAA